jgi:RimJ/RimL family protein N-acetyltransferase
MILECPLRTRQLRLATLSPTEHAGAPYLAWMNDPEITRQTESAGRMFDRSDLEDYIVDCNNDTAQLLLGMFDLADGAHVGNIKLGPIELRHRRADIGLIIGDKTKWGRGFAREAIAAVTEHAFGALRLSKATAGCYTSNLASARAFLAVGWHEEGRRRRHGLVDGQWEDLIQLARFRDDA